MSGNPHHMHLQPRRNIYLTSWFILSVLFLTDCEMSVVPTSVRDLLSQELYPGRNVYLTSWVLLPVLFLTGGKTSVVFTPVHHLPSQGSPPWWEHLHDQLVHSVCVIFDRRRDIMRNSTLVGMSNSAADSFCLCCL